MTSLLEALQPVRDFVEAEVENRGAAGSDMSDYQDEARQALDALDAAIGRATKTPRFQLGQQFSTRGKHPRLCTVTDILRTYNDAGELVRLRYVATHQLCGQTVTDYDVVETTIALGAIA
jgi:hypothetical protein